MTKAKKITAVLLLLVLVAAACVAGTALARDGEGDYLSKGGWSSTVVSRLNVNVAPSDIVLIKDGSSSGIKVRIAITVSKTEPDFYGELTSFTHEAGGLDYSISWERDDKSIPSSPHTCVLTTEDGAPKVYTWYAVITLPAEASGTITMNLTMGFITGKNRLSAKSGEFVIPVNISLLDEDSLENAIQAGKAVQNREYYTAISVLVLDDTIADAEAVLANLSGSSPEQVNDAITAVYTAIEALEYRPADYSRIETLKLSIPDRTLYTAQSLERLDAALQAIKYDKYATQQAQVDAWGYELEAAINALYPASFKLIAGEGITVNEAAKTVTVPAGSEQKLAELLTANFGVVKINDDAGQKTADIVYRGQIMATYTITIVK